MNRLGRLAELSKKYEYRWIDNYLIGVLSILVSDEIWDNALERTESYATAFQKFDHSEVKTEV